jgi:catechol 2,3-dioxygenase-like lactoylglutathione lyase family enzyme
MSRARLVPELLVSDIGRSLDFYLRVCDWRVLWQRPEEGFAYLGREGAELMLEEPRGRVWLAGPLEHPFGRGMNLQIEVGDVDALHAAVRDAGHELFLPLEERWYRTGGVLGGNRQFIVADPDGYLLRFFSDLGTRPA